MLRYRRSLNTVAGNSWSNCARRGSLAGISNAGGANDDAFTKSLCLPINSKSTFNYCALFDAAGKVHLASAVTTRRKTDREWFIGVEWHEKLNRSYPRNLTIFAPLIQRREYFVQNHHAGDARRDDQRFASSTWEKPNRWQYGAKALKTSSGEEPNSDRSYR